MVRRPSSFRVREREGPAHLSASGERERTWHDTEKKKGTEGKRGRGREGEETEARWEESAAAFPLLFPPWLPTFLLEEDASKKKAKQRYG